MHYIMRCDRPINAKGEAQQQIHNCFKAGRVRLWRGGRHLLEADSLPSPIPVDFEPLKGYLGPPMELYDVCIPLMSARLAAVLVAAGVDNVAFYPALLTNTITGETYDYHAFNVVGAVAAADLERSEWSTFDGWPVADVSFTRFELNAEKAERHLFFRLAENINALVVHESVRNRVIEAGIDTVRFLEPHEWMHL
jgi:hypothetical protein